MLHISNRHPPAKRVVLLAGVVGCALTAFGGEIYDFTRQPFHLAYADWENNVKQEDGAITIRASGLNGGGGVLGAISQDLSGEAASVMALTLKIGEANQASTLQIRLVDLAGGQGVWNFPLTGLPSGKPVTILAEGNATLGNPVRGKGKLNLKKICQWHVQGSWLFNGKTSVDLLKLATSAAGAAPASTSPAATTPSGKPVVVQDFTQKEGTTIYGFLAWEGHVAGKDGVSVIAVPKGFGGAHFFRTQTIDLRGHEQDTLSLTVRARGNNTAKTLSIALWDAAKNDKIAGHDGAWTFDLANLKPGDTTNVIAKDAVSLAMGAKGRGPLTSWDLGRIKEVLVMGSTGINGPTAFDLIKLETVPATPALDAARMAAAERELQRTLANLPHYSLFGDITPMARTERSPDVAGICLVAPDVLALTIESGQWTLGNIQDYAPQAGDVLTPSKRGNGLVEIEVVMLKRGGKEVGEVIDFGGKRQCVTVPTYQGDLLQTDLADHARCYTISSTEDPAYAARAHPADVHRKTKPIAGSQWTGQVLRHTLFLHLPKPLLEGKTYQIDCGPLNVKTPLLTFRNAPQATRSPAIHTTQIGYRADDPFKRGYLSIWLGVSAWTGTSGAFRYPAGLKFHLLDDASGKVVYSGSVELAKAANEAEPMFLNSALGAKSDINYNGTDVYRMDFSSFTTPGHYRLYVEGIGCGYPFAIGPETWDHAFWVQMRGYYHQRSGIPQAPPYSTFVKPRDHHFDDVPVILTKYTFPIWNGEKSADLWEGLKSMATDQRMTNGWGGYHDAGDWNPRRVSHMQATMAQLEIADLFPAYVEKVKLNIPQDYKIPDVLNEALFEIDCFRRMQTPDGGVGWGLETAGDPIGRATSWLSRVLPVYECSPEAGSTWFYASVAARAAHVLKRTDAKLAAIYEDSARKAMIWAEADFARQCREKGRTCDDLKWTVRDTRNLAAVEMLRLTGDQHWHDVFMENTILTNDNPTIYAYGKAIQEDAAFAYAIADEKLTDPIIRKRAIQGLERQATIAAAYADGNAFDMVSQDKGRPLFMGQYSTPRDAHVVLRAYHLTGKPEYLVAGLRASQFSSGANPENLVETTGLGSNSIKHPMWLDAPLSGQPTPEGITVYGIDDWHLGGDQGVANMSPPYLKWPVTESYTDTGGVVIVNEFTVDQVWTYTTWAWGYLAARPIAK